MRWFSGRELAHSDRAGRRGLKDHQCLAVVTDGQRAVEALLDIHACTGIADALRAGRDLQPFTVERDRVVVGDGALVLETEGLFGL